MQLHLYHTLGCHLCELAEAVIDEVAQRPEYKGLTLLKIDIAEHSDLVDRFGVRIPVVHLPPAERDLGWPFDSDQLVAYLQQC